jgi:hypothetical protein
MVDQEKCTMPSVLIVEMSVKSLSNLTESDLFIAEIVTLKEDPREEIGIKFTG